jgi:diguanylate cyclase (GGDEF)-like protein
MHGSYYLRQLILHLIRKHHFRKIAYICPWSYDGRNEMYIRTLTNQGLFDPELYVSETELKGLNMYERVKKAISILLDDRNAAFDAIIAMTMEEAYTVQMLLKQRGYSIPKDIAVCSYEDGQLVKYASPSITSIYFPMKELGYSGAEKLIQTVKTGVQPPNTMVPSRIEYRESCGCPSSGKSMFDIEKEIAQLARQNEERGYYFHLMEEVNQMLVTSYTKRELFEVLGVGLDKLNVLNGAMYEISQENRDFGSSVLKFQLKDAKRHELLEQVSFMAMKEANIPANRRVTYVAELLHIADEHFGFILVETAGLDVRNYLSLAVNLSIALKSINLINKLEEEIHLRKSNEIRFMQLAHYDQLTGLYNRSSFHEQLMVLCMEKRPFSLMFMDIDGFKPVNDTFGHDVGDLLLDEIAKRLRLMLRSCVLQHEGYGGDEISRGAIFRLGGDEFTAIVAATNNRKLHEIAAAVVAAFAQPFHIHHYDIRIGISIGYSKFPEDTDDYNKLIKYADRAMYAAKGTGNGEIYRRIGSEI